MANTGKASGIIDPAIGPRKLFCALDLTID
jgi:hypothetical protein